MSPLCIQDAFDQGYRISTKTYAEKIAFLSACNKLSIYWQSGIDALGFIPSIDNPVFVYHADGRYLTFSYFNTGAYKTIPWADLGFPQGQPVPQFVY